MYREIPFHSLSLPCQPDQDMIKPFGSGTRCSMRLSQQIQVSLALAFLLAGVSGPALAQYRLGSGDIIDVSVFGRTDLSRRTGVDADGNISVPLVGEINVSDMALTDLRSKLKNLLSTNESIRPADVLVELIEYRPFYIHGDVAKAGSYPFKPNLTVRQAIALSGGIDITREGARRSPLESAELRGRHNALLIEAAKQQIRVTGLRAELEGNTGAKIASPTISSASKDVMSEIAQLEQQSLKARVTALAQERQYLDRALELSDANISALDRGQSQDEEAAKQQAEELARIAELSRRGLAAPGRVSEEQRATVLLKSREMDTKARLAIARQAREELRRKLEKADDRQTRVTRELQDAITSLEGLYTQLTAVREQLALVGDVASQTMANDQNPPEILIIRKVDGSSMKLAADEDRNIEPGDVVEVKLKPSWSNFGLGN